MLKDSQTHRPSQCATFYGEQHIFSPAKLFKNMISKSVYHICTTGGVIRVLKEMEDLNRELYSNYFNALLISRSAASPHVHVQYVQCTNLQATAVRGAVINKSKKKCADHILSTKK